MPHALRGFYAKHRDTNASIFVRDETSAYAYLQLPIYDSRAARFYLFEAPGSDQPLGERIIKLTAFYEFLEREFARVIHGCLLAPAIAPRATPPSATHRREDY
jgi:hypothetical protein